MTDGENPLTTHLRMMLRIRRFEETLLACFRTGELRGTAHVCLGQEGVAAGACAALGAADYVTSNHRGHGHMIARGADMNKLMAELFGKATGYSLGRGGSQHIAAHEVGFLGSNGITAGGLPVATGAALSLQQRKIAGVVLAFFGDGAVPQGAFHEAMNFAALWKLPLIFLCENNQYAMGTPVRATSPTATIAQRAVGYNMQHSVVDGNNPLAVEQAVADARDRAVNKEGATFIEAVTWRAAGHSRSDMCGYRSREEEEAWQARDPIMLATDLLRGENIASAEALASMQDEIEVEIEAALAFARASNPLPKERATDLVYPTTHAPLPPNAEDGSAPRECSYAEALYRALARALGDDSVILLGEDIARYEGAFKVTRDLAKRFGADRVRDTPISENTIVGMGVGGSLTGLRPVCELMFMDFMLLAMDQLGNHAAKFYYIYGGQSPVPLTVRMPAGGRRGYGATHSQCLETLLMSLPGLKVFTPATVQDAYDLLLAAIFDDAPVAFVEHKLLYATKAELDESAAPLPPGKARIARGGSDLTIVTYSHMLTLALDAATYLSKEDGIEAEVIDLRTLVPLDMATVNESACRTTRVLIAEEGHRRGGVGAELAARVQEECFGYLDAPVLRVAAADSPIPTVEHLEKVVLPQVGDIVAAARQLLA